MFSQASDCEIEFSRLPTFLKGGSLVGMDQIPEAPGWGNDGKYPLAGERIGPAWRAVWLRLWLRRTTYTSGVELATWASGTYGIAPKTTANLLRAASRAGILESRLRLAGRPARRAAQYRVSRKWVARLDVELA